MRSIEESGPIGAEQMALDQVQMVTCLLRREQLVDDGVDHGSRL